MTVPDPPLGHPPAGAVRELLQAIRDYLDLPPVADWDEEPKRDAELQDRVGHLVGRLEVILTDGTVEDAVETIRGELARELPYTPETAAQMAERHAMLAAHLTERPPLKLIGDRGPDGTVGV
jgi:hypothetical protein